MTCDSKSIASEGRDNRITASRSILFPRRQTRGIRGPRQCKQPDIDIGLFRFDRNGLHRYRCYVVLHLNGVDLRVNLLLEVDNLLSEGLQVFLRPANVARLLPHAAGRAYRGRQSPAAEQGAKDTRNSIQSLGL